MKPSEILREARKRIPDEEHWWRGGRLHRGSHCAGTAINSVGYGLESITTPESKEAHLFMQDAIGDGRNVPQWNDDPHTSFEDLQLAFKRAIEAAEAVGR